MEIREIIKDPIQSQIIHQLALICAIKLKVNCRGVKKYIAKLVSLFNHVKKQVVV